jgi:hypothetical protein
MTNVKFFDKNGVEVKVGDVVISNNGSKGLIEFFRYGSDKYGCAHIGGYHGFFPLENLTKHTPKLIKVKRTFEEVCELVKQECLFKSNLNGAVHFNSSTSLYESGDMFIAGVAVKNLKFKRKNSEVWEDLEYKEVEE